MKYVFSKQCRILHKDEYKEIFSGCKKDYKTIKVVYKKNKSMYSRLGLVVAKRNLRLAVHRNKAKRIIRESFRIHRHIISSFDIVILIKKLVNCLDQKEQISLRNDLKSCWEFLSKK